MIEEGTPLSLNHRDCLRACKSQYACKAILLSALAGLTWEDSAGVKGGEPDDRGQGGESRRAGE